MNRTVTALGLEPFLPALRKRNGKLPADLEILFDETHFGDNTLDVSLLFPFADPKNCVISFARLPKDLFEIGRLMGRFEIFFGRAPRTVQSHLNLLTNFFNDLGRRRNYVDFRFIDIKDVRRVLDDGKRSPDNCRKVCTALKYLFMIAGNLYDRQMFNMDQKALDELRGEYSRLANATQNANKTPDIDPEYFDELNTRLPMIATDETVPINYRMTALEIWLEMWTGLRASEPFTLKTTSHLTKRSANGRNTEYLRYNPNKLQHGGRIRVWCDTYALPMAVAAFDMLMELRKQVPGWESTDNLFILDGPESPEKGFKYYSERLYTNYLTDISTVQWSEVRCHSIKGKTYYYPNSTQFRVHLCGWLYHQNVNLSVIELGMSHLTEDMKAYYVRVKDKTFSLQQRRSDNVIRTHMNNDFALGEDEYAELGERLLADLVLNLNKYKTSKARYDEMVVKGYDYEIDRYGKQILNYISTELRPALSYMDRIVRRDGLHEVMKAHPSLLLVKDHVDELIKDFELWQGKVSKK